MAETTESTGLHFLLSCHFTLACFCTVQNRLTSGTAEKGAALTRPASLTFAGKDCERYANQLPSLLSAMASASGDGARKVLPLSER